MSATLNYRKYVTPSPSCHRGHGTGAVGVDEGVPDPAPARVWIQLVVIGAEVGDLDLAYTIVEAVLPPLADLLSTNRRGPGFG